MHFVKVVTDSEKPTTYHILLINDVEKTTYLIRTFENSKPEIAIEYAKYVADYLKGVYKEEVEAVY